MNEIDRSITELFNNSDEWQLYKLKTVHHVKKCFDITHLCKQKLIRLRSRVSDQVLVMREKVCDKTQ